MALSALGLFAGAALAQGASICVVVPHFKDEYWLSVGHGLQQEAAATGTRLLIFESGGYRGPQRQIALLQLCGERGVDAVLFGAVSADDPALLAAVERVSRTVPVLALVNELHSDHLAGAIGVDWREMGRAVGYFLAARHPKGSPPQRAAFVTGPATSGWSPLLELGLREMLAQSSVTIAVTRHSDTGLREQLREVEGVLADYPELDYLIGSAPAIEGAMGLAARTEARFPALIATYVSHSVRRGLQGGAVEAASFDDPVQQGRLGVRMALRAAVQPPMRGLRGPPIRLIRGGTADAYDVDLSPADLVLVIE